VKAQESFSALFLSFLTTPECVETEGIKKKFFLFTGHTAGHACRLKCY